MAHGKIVAEEKIIYVRMPQKMNKKWGYNIFI